MTIDIEDIQFAKNKLLKTKKNEYTLEDIELVFKELEKGTHHKTISEMLNKFSTRQIKLIRLIWKKGTKQDIELLKSCEFKVSSIKRYMRAKQKAQKHENPIYKLNQIMEQGMRKGSLTQRKKR